MSLIISSVAKSIADMWLSNIAVVVCIGKSTNYLVSQRVDSGGDTQA